jgi:TPP-dependent pyruvate/acetoin dehydrogenase alpha subunit
MQPLILRLRHARLRAHGSAQDDSKYKNKSKYKSNDKDNFKSRDNRRSFDCVCR